MQGISSSTDYSYLLEDMILTDVNEIRKSAVLQHLGGKMDRAMSVANEITSSMGPGGYQMDNVIPEDSTFSIHV